MLKTEARKYFSKKRKALSAQDRMKKDDLMLIQLQTIALPSITFLLSYWPMEETHEPNTLLFSDYLEFQNPNMILCYPKTDFNTIALQAIQTDDDTRFRKNNYNIYEPENGFSVNPKGIDMVLVPLLAYDKKGYRSGYGKGFYDRYLDQCRSDCMKIGFSYFEPVEAFEDGNDFDLPLDLCVTPETVYAF
jgi:5-formyltetrahydrofolate cyclo-ligase